MSVAARRTVAAKYIANDSAVEVPLIFGKYGYLLGENIPTVRDENFEK